MPREEDLIDLVNKNYRYYNQYPYHSNRMRSKLSPGSAVDWAYDMQL